MWCARGCDVHAIFMWSGVRPSPCGRCSRVLAFVRSIARRSVASRRDARLRRRTRRWQDCTQMMLINLHIRNLTATQWNNHIHLLDYWNIIPIVTIYCSMRLNISPDVWHMGKQNANTCDHLCLILDAASAWIWKEGITQWTFCSSFQSREYPYKYNNMVLKSKRR